MKYFVIAFAVLLSLLGMLLFLPRVVNWDRTYGEKISAQLAAVFDNNASVRIGGKVTGSFIFPKISVGNVYLETRDQKSTISIEKIEFKPSFISMILLAPSIDHITVYGAKIAHDDFIKTISEKSAFSIKLVNSTLTIGSTQSSGKTVYIKNAAIFKNSARQEISGAMTIGKNDYIFTSLAERTGNEHYKTVVKIRSTASEASIVGAREGGIFQGDIQAKGSDLSSFINDFPGTDKLSFFSMVSSNENFDFSATVRSDADLTQIDQISFNSNSLKLAGNISKHADSSINADLVITDLNIDSLTTGERKYVSAEYSILDHFNSVIPPQLQSDIKIKANSIKFRGRESKDLDIAVTISDGQFLIDRMSVTLPGNKNHLSISGKANSDTIHTKFIGQVTGSGDDFDTLAEWMLLTEIPAQKRYNKNRMLLSANIYLAPRIVDISAFNLVMDRGSVDGELRIKKNQKSNSIVGDLSVSQVDIDRFFGSITKNVQPSISGEWLRSVAHNVHVNTKMSNSTWKGKNVDSLRFETNLAKNRLSIDKISFVSAGDQLNASVLAYISPQDIRPSIFVDVVSKKWNLGEIDVSRLITRNDTPEGKKIMWTTEAFGFGALGRFDGIIRTKIDSLETNLGEFSSCIFDASLKDGLFIINKFSINTQSGFVVFSGNVGMSSAPSLSAVFSSSSLEIEDLCKYLGLENVQGNLSVSGSIRTQGTNMLEWVSQLSGKTSFALRGVEVQGIDFNSFIRDLFLSKNKSDVATMTQISLYTGKTFFEQIDGSATINAGIVSSSADFKITNASGAIASNLSLIQLINVTLVRFFFIPPNSTSPTFMDMSIKGPILQPKITFNVDDLYDIVLGKRRTGA